MNIYTGFGQIFWGLVLVILNLRINGFDMLPDFIGYILVAIGCGGLTNMSGRFATARRLSWILVVLSLVDFVLPEELASVYAVAHRAINCTMIWFLLGAVMELASARRHPDLRQRASICRAAYIVLQCIATLVWVIAHGSSDAATLMLVMYVICIIPLLVLILHLIHRVQHELSTN